MESTQKESLAIDLRPWIRGESPFPRRDLLQEGQLERQGEFRLADLAAAGEVAGEKLKDLGVLTAGLDLRDPAADGRSRQSGGGGYERDATIPQGEGLACSPASSRLLVEDWRQRLILLSDPSNN